MISMIPLRNSFQFSWTRQLRQYKHVLCCSSQYRNRFLHRCLLVFCKALLLASEFPTSFERFSWYVQILHHLVQWRRYHLIVWHYRGFSIAHFCFAFRFDASDICFHISGHTLSGRGVVCFLVSLSPDHVYPSGGLSFNNMNLVKPVHASDNSFSSSTFQ